MRGSGAGAAALLLLVPAILMVGFYGGTGFMATMMGGHFSAAEFSKPSGVAKTEDNRKVTILVGDGRKASAREIAAHLEHDRIVPDRNVRISRVFAISDLLEPEQALPADDLRDLWVDARLARFMEAECAALVESGLAASCAPDNARAKAASDQPELYTLSMSVQFTLAESAGAVPDSETLKLNHATIHGEETLDGVSGTSAVVGLHKKVYAKAMLACTEYRAELGNCAVHSVSLRQNRGPKANTYSTLVTLSYLTPMVAAETAPASVAELQKIDAIRKAAAEKRQAQRAEGKRIEQDALAQSHVYSPYEISVAAAKGQVLPEKKAQAPAPSEPEIRQAETVGDAAETQTAQAPEAQAPVTGQAAPDADIAQAVPEAPPANSAQPAKPLPQGIQTASRPVARPETRVTADADQVEQWKAQAREMFRSGKRAVN